MNKTYKLILFLAISLGVSVFLLKDSSFMRKIVPVGNELDFSQQQVEKIENIIHNYILNNPDVLLEANKKIQEQEIDKQRIQLEQIKDKIAVRKEQIFAEDNLGRIVLGNPDGDIIIATFTQHQCPACKKTNLIMDEIIEANPKIKSLVIYWPFLGEDAIYSAKAVIAAKQQNKEQLLNRLIFNDPEIVNKEHLNKIIADHPEIDGQALKEAIENESLNEALVNNSKLSEELALGGTPALVIANRELSRIVFVPSYTENLKEDILQAIESIKN